MERRRNKEGVPTFGGEPEKLALYKEDALQYATRLEHKKRYLAGPRLLQELTGVAKTITRAQTLRDPQWLSHPRGVYQRLEFLESMTGPFCFGRCCAWLVEKRRVAVPQPEEPESLPAKLTGPGAGSANPGGSQGTASARLDVTERPQLCEVPGHSQGTILQQEVWFLRRLLIPKFRTCQNKGVRHFFVMFAGRLSSSWAWQKAKWMRLWMALLLVTPGEDEENPIAADVAAPEESVQPKVKLTEDEEMKRCIEFIRKHAPTIQYVETPATDRLKYQCTVCRSKRHPEGKVNTLQPITIGRMPRLQDVEHFLKQHLKCPPHLAATSARAGGPLVGLLPAAVDGPVFERQGFVVDAFFGPRLSRILHIYEEEFKFWAAYATSNSLKHHYVHDLGANKWILSSTKCQRNVTSGVTFAWNAWFWATRAVFSARCFDLCANSIWPPTASLLEHAPCSADGEHSKGCSPTIQTRSNGCASPLHQTLPLWRPILCLRKSQWRKSWLGLWGRASRARDSEGRGRDSCSRSRDRNGDGRGRASRARDLCGRDLGGDASHAHSFLQRIKGEVWISPIGETSCKRQSLWMKLTLSISPAAV